MEAAVALCSLSFPPALTHFPFSNRCSCKPHYPTISSSPNREQTSFWENIIWGDMHCTCRRASSLGSPEKKADYLSPCFSRQAPYLLGCQIKHPSFRRAYDWLWPGTTFEFAPSLVEQLYGVTVAGKVSLHAQLVLISTADGQASVELNKVEWTFDHTPRVLIPIANGSEAIEVVTIADVLRRAKMDVVLASVGKSRQILVSRDTRIIVDKLISDAAEATYDLIILPGGKEGAESLYRSRTLKRLLKEQNLPGRICGAICPSPANFRRSGLPKENRTDAHDSGMRDLNSEGGNAAKVVIDGNVITSRGLASSMEFALTVVSKVFGQGRAKSVAEGLVFDYSRSSS